MAASTVVIVGAGPAGIRAAEVLAAADVAAILIDEAQAGGGQIYRRQPDGFRRSADALYGSEAARAVSVHAALDRLKPEIDYRPRTLAWGLEGRRLHLHAIDKGTVETLGFDALIVASGATDRVFPVPGWTLPGVFTLGGSQIALKAQATAIGARPAFMGAGPLLYLVAAQYLKAGVTPAAVLDTARRRDGLLALPGLAARPRAMAQGFGFIRALMTAGVRIEKGVTPVAIEGEDGGIGGVVYRDRAGRTHRIAADAVGMGYHLRAESQLADLARIPFRYDSALAQHLPDADISGRTPVAGVYLAGDGMQLAGADGAEASGRLAAWAVLRDLGCSVDDAAEAAALRACRRQRRFRDGVARAFPWPGARLAAALPDQTLLCRCEEVTVGALRAAARNLGAAEINRAKALCRVGMGRCQGRYCGLAAADVLAAELGVPTAAVGRLRGQSPVKPLPANLKVVS